MPAPPARQRSTRIPWGTSSTSILPAAICSSLAVGVPGRTENAAISFFTWLFSARIWPRVAPASPRELQTSVSSFVPWSRRAQIRAVAKRCATPKPAMATVAPLGMSATACSGDATILFMAILSSREWLRRTRTRISREHTRARVVASRQRERDDVVADLRPQSGVTTGGDHDELFAARRAVRHGRRLCARRQLTAPEHCPGVDVEGAQRRITCRADENQSARGREGAAEVE